MEGAAARGSPARPPPWRRRPARPSRPPVPKPRERSPDRPRPSPPARRWSGATARPSARPTPGARRTASSSPRGTGLLHLQPGHPGAARRSRPHVGHRHARARRCSGSERGGSAPTPAPRGSASATSPASTAALHRPGRRPRLARERPRRQHPPGAARRLRGRGRRELLRPGADPGRLDLLIAQGASLVLIGPSLDLYGPPGRRGTLAEPRRPPPRQVPGPGGTGNWRGRGSLAGNGLMHDLATGGGAAIAPGLQFADDYAVGVLFVGPGGDGRHRHPDPPARPRLLGGDGLPGPRPARRRRHVGDGRAAGWT